ncbi:MAG: hypothetical protein NVSMB2_29010 [Chloroflexota bacterium]
MQQPCAMGAGRYVELDTAHLVERVHWLACDSQLRVAATTLSHADPGAVSATTVVGDLDPIDVAVFDSLITEIGGALALDADVELSSGSFSVRFTRRHPIGSN